MFRKTKRLSSVLFIGIALAALGAVYAALSGTLTFNGKATLSDKSTVLEISALIASDGDVAAKLASYGTMTVAPDGQTADITVHLMAPGNSLTFMFEVENTGDTGAEITDVITSAPSEVSIGGNYENLKTQVIPFGSTSPNYSITVGWDSGYPLADDDFTFTIELLYEKAV